MSRKIGAKNKPKETLTMSTLRDVETPEVASKWLSMSRRELMRRIHAKEIPEDCYFKVGNRVKLVTNKLALYFGIKVA